jgi:hypothetical protein
MARQPTFNFGANAKRPPAKAAGAKAKGKSAKGGKGKSAWAAYTGGRRSTGAPL